MSSHISDTNEEQKFDSYATNNSSTTNAQTQFQSSSQSQSTTAIAIVNPYSPRQKRKYEGWIRQELCGTIIPEPVSKSERDEYTKAFINFKYESTTYGKRTINWNRTKEYRYLLLKSMR